MVVTRVYVLNYTFRSESVLPKLAECECDVTDVILMSCHCVYRPQCSRLRR